MGDPDSAIPSNTEVQPHPAGVQESGSPGPQPPPPQDLGVPVSNRFVRTSEPSTLTLPSPGSGGGRVKRGRAVSETAQTRRADVTALTQGNLPSTPSSPGGAPQVSGSEAGRAAKRGAHGIPARGEFLLSPGTRDGWRLGKSRGGVKVKASRDPCGRAPDRPHRDQGQISNNHAPTDSIRSF